DEPPVESSARVPAAGAASADPASGGVVVEDRAVTASRHAAPIRPTTRASTLANIGNDSESNVNEQAVPARAAPASAAQSRRSSGSLLLRRALKATTTGTTKKIVRATTPTKPSSIAVFRNWLS